MDNHQDVTTNDIMSFLQNNMVLKSDFNAFKEENNKDHAFFREQLEENNKDHAFFREQLEENNKDHATFKNQMVTKDYLDNKNADLGSEIGKRIERAFEKERKFKRELVTILKSSSVFDHSAIEKLEELI